MNVFLFPHTYRAILQNRNDVFGKRHAGILLFWARFINVILAFSQIRPASKKGCIRQKFRRGVRRILKHMLSVPIFRVPLRDSAEKISARSKKRQPKAELPLIDLQEVFQWTKKRRKKR